jgi:pimeloyl-ACP methyl ester carboxylesterase
MLIYLEAGILIVLFRIGCQRYSQTRFGFALQLLSGLWLGMGAWLAGGLLHAWVPIWQMLLLGLFLGAFIRIIDTTAHRSVRPAADLLAIGVLGLLSVVPVSVAVMTGAALMFAALGLAIDAIAGRLPRRIQAALTAVPVVVLILMGLNVQQADDFGSRLLSQDRLFPLRLAFAAPLPGERVQLKSGTIAWRLTDPAGRSGAIAILIHGNDSAGSWQPAAIALQGALLRAGYDVLSVDHPGYGASPHPNPDADASAWDPRFGLREALAYAQANERVKPPTATILVAHSMGVDTALQWLDEGIPVQDVYLFAGAITRPAPEDEDFKLFHAQRRMACCVPLATLRLIKQQFYSSAELYAHALPMNHPLVHFVRFGIEYWDVAADREPLFAAISAPKASCDFPGVSHYFNSLLLRRFILLDTRTTVRAAKLFAVAGADAASSACSGSPQL